MKLVIVTGMSGAGRSTAMKMIEDMGFFCIDNLPIPLLDKLVELSVNLAELQKIAIGIDVRNGKGLSSIKDTLDQMDAKGIAYEILYMDAEDEVLLKRYKETRRNHPLAAGERIDKGIQEERKELS